MTLINLNLKFNKLTGFSGISLEMGESKMTLVKYAQHFAVFIMLYPPENKTVLQTNYS